MRSIDDIRVGAYVLDRGGTDVGTVKAVGTRYFVLVRLSIFGRDLFVPFSAVDRADPVISVVRLNVAKDDLDELGWHQPPELLTGRAGSDNGASHLAR